MLNYSQRTAKSLLRSESGEDSPVTGYRSLYHPCCPCQISSCILDGATTLLPLPSCPHLTQNGLHIATLYCITTSLSVEKLLLISGAWIICPLPSRKSQGHKVPGT